MTKTSHSKIYSTESGITGGGFFKTHPLHFTKEQLEWIENIQLPKRLFLISATEFDDRYLYLHDDWRYRFSGNNWLYYSLLVNTFVIYHQFHSSS